MRMKGTNKSKLPVTQPPHLLQHLPEIPVSLPRFLTPLSVGLSFFALTFTQTRKKNEKIETSSDKR
jgi:hypothetical protein